MQPAKLDYELLFRESPDVLLVLLPASPRFTAIAATNSRLASTHSTLSKTVAVQKYDIPLPGGGFEVKYWSPRNLPVLAETGEVLSIMHRAVDVTDLVRAGELGQELRGRDLYCLVPVNVPLPKAPRATLPLTVLPSTLPVYLMVRL